MDFPLSDPALLPGSAELRSRFQSLAMLDAILSPEWEFRYFSFNAGWSPEGAMASMRDGEGSEYFFLFAQAGTAGKIYQKGLQLPEIDQSLAQIPPEFSSFSTEPAFDLKRATCYLLQRQGSDQWTILPKPATGIPFLAFVADSGEFYHEWAMGYYEIDLPLEPIRAIFRREPVTATLVAGLNPRITLEDLIPDCREIDYPVKPSEN